MLLNFERRYFFFNNIQTICLEFIFIILFYKIMFCTPLPSFLDEINSEMISGLPFTVRITDSDWPFSPEQLPPLLEKPKHKIFNGSSQNSPDTSNFNAQNISLAAFNMPQHQLSSSFLPQPSSHIKNDNRPNIYENKEYEDGYRQTPSYEKRRMVKLMKKIEDFQLEKSRPFLWMSNTFGKMITQKEFNKIYTYLKELLPANQAPNRDVNRNQKFRLKWMDDIWDDENSRKVLQQLITSTMMHQI
ncbi:hypothetical protein TRFO_13141 [Tritrichomonas foetus]|uniref:Uncharacterized protein n=1 Tax=Tritrichomonas foetus TaxID=1144522 RepID=A0A1J4KZ64_9EUKA|nr:hypothetical protein TRFO_13141 [Tritrichomonas foetus]|eukprot:OHT16547.1 hypothetical protein TRFO_13141 [Tritrichomonas foetus]